MQRGRKKPSNYKKREAGLLDYLSTHPDGTTVSGYLEHTKYNHSEIYPVFQSLRIRGLIEVRKKEGNELVFTSRKQPQPLVPSIEQQKGNSMTNVKLIKILEYLIGDKRITPYELLTQFGVTRPEVTWMRDQKYVKRFRGYFAIDEAGKKWYREFLDRRSGAHLKTAQTA